MNLLKEKGIPIDKQLKSWHEMIKRPYNRDEVEQYTRTRQILMNGIETEAWNFKHSFMRKSDNIELNKQIANIRRIENMQQMTVNWLSPSRQTILDTTLAYEQVAVDLTAWLSQNEDNEYVKETFDFGLLEDFDHLYRYAQFSILLEDTNPNEILKHSTDVMIGRPTQYHHNCNGLRIRKPYDKEKTSAKTKVNILTLISAEQQTHNYYAEHGFMYPNADLKRLYAEICDVEEEHVTMYETLVDSNESYFEKWLIHEYAEACCYHNCYIDEKDNRIKEIWEEMFMMEIEHLKLAAQIYEKYEKKDADELLGKEEIYPCHFQSQKEYVQKILNKEANKRVDKNGTFNTTENLDDDWRSYKIQEILFNHGAPSEQAINLSIQTIKRDYASADDETLNRQSDILEKSLEKIKAPNTIGKENYDCFKNVNKNVFLY